MKKLIFYLIGIALTLTALFSPTLTYAACLPTQGTSCTGGLNIACFDNGSLANCCDSFAACQSLGGQPVVVPPGSSATPTVPPTTPPTNPPTTQPDPNNDIFCNNHDQINTAIGCIPVLSNTNDFISFVLKWAIGIGGGIAFLLIVYASFMITTSSGNPDRLKAGQELLTSAIAGLIMLIFSIFILRIIGINILGIFS